MYLLCVFRFSMCAGIFTALSDLSGFYIDCCYLLTAYTFALNVCRKQCMKFCYCIHSKIGIEENGNYGFALVHNEKKPLFYGCLSATTQVCLACLMLTFHSSPFWLFIAKIAEER